MKLYLPEVTLVMVETREHELAYHAVLDSVKQVDFGEVLILTDRPSEFWGLTQYNVKHRIHEVEDWPEKLGWSRSWWYDVPPLVRTAFTLNIQWDSWVYESANWDDEFLKYDYVGAPWWYKDGMNVGNGGFSLVSTPLKRFLWTHQREFPCNTSADDDLLCRKYRPQLEAEGFRWAPENVASRFAFECVRETKNNFGFHGMFNWGEVLPRDELLDRVELALASPYISNPDGYLWKAFIEKNPDILLELGDRRPPLKLKGA